MKRFNHFSIILFFLSVFQSLLLSKIILPVFAKPSGEPITNQQCNVFTFDASGSYDEDSQDLNFFWDFGDGQTSAEPIVTHTYKKADDYVVHLKIKDNSGLDCSTGITSQTVRVNIPPYVNFSAPEIICAEQPITLDASASYTESKGALSYSWDFGDGTTALDKTNLTKVYTKGGNYKISLTVTDTSATTCHSKTLEKVVLVNEPPRVQISGGEEILKCVSEDDDYIVEFDASASSDINSDQLNYEWDFGDGMTEKGAKVTHSYAQLGIYDARLVVKDNTRIGCGTNVKFVRVKLTEAPVADAGEDIVSCVGREIVFDGSQSYSNPKGTLAAKWTFDDGASADGLKVAHTYAKPGRYQARLTVESKLNSMCPSSSDTREIIVNSTPMVSIKSPDAICLGANMHFDASSANDPDGDALEHYWSFGDGTILRSGAKVAHEYKQGGQYRVSVIVDDKKGSACSTAMASKTVKINTPPIADAGPNLACCVAVATKFDASTSNDPDQDQLTYHWDFGDGQKAEGMVVDHDYKKNGSYKVTLTVDDQSKTSCSQSTAGFVADVNAKPVPVMSVR